LKYLEVIERGPNYYSVLYVAPTSSGGEEILISRSSTSAEIRKAWKKKSLELHPDKNPAPSATQEFERVKEAYDV
jgi:DnaJ-class molecular chaperone